MSAKIITIAIEKGGTGKTVTASNLAYLMGDEGKKFFAWILIRRKSHQSTQRRLEHHK